MSAARRQTEGEALAQKLKAAMDTAFSGSLNMRARSPRARFRKMFRPDRQKLGTMSSGDVEAELELVRVSDPSAGKIWLIASDTLAKVPELYDQVEARQVETRLPKWAVKHQLAGMPLWQWFALLLLIPVAAAAAWLMLVRAANSLAVVGAKTRADRAGIAGSFWRRMAAGGDDHPQILAAYLGMPLLQRHYYNAGHRSRGDHRR